MTGRFPALYFRVLKSWLRPAAVSAAIALSFSVAVRWLFLFPVTVDTSAMRPFLQPGQTVFFWWPQWKQAAAGQVVLVRAPQGNLYLICRVQAREGQVVTWTGTSLQNGRHDVPDRDPLLMSTGQLPVEVRPGFFYCLNDDLADLQDSRSWGLFAMDSIAGVYAFRSPGL